MSQFLFTVPISEVRDCFGNFAGLREHKIFLRIEEQDIADFLEDEIDLMSDILRIVIPIVVEPL